MNYMSPFMDNKSLLVSESLLTSWKWTCILFLNCMSFLVYLLEILLEETLGTDLTHICFLLVLRILIKNSYGSSLRGFLCVKTIQLDNQKFSCIQLAGTYITLRSLYLLQDPEVRHKILILKLGIQKYLFLSLSSKPIARILETMTEIKFEIT